MFILNRKILCKIIKDNLLSKGDLVQAHKMGTSSDWSGAAIGAGVGSGSAYYSARQQGIDPWTGAKENSLGIGRGQDQVDSFSRDMNIETIKKNSFGKEWPDSDLKAYLGKDLVNPEAIKFQKDFISTAINEGKYIYQLRNPTLKDTVLFII